jgi:hypothetical protein
LWASLRRNVVTTTKAIISSAVAIWALVKMLSIFKLFILKILLKFIGGI